MRERIDSCDREGKVRIILVRESESIRLDTETEAIRVAIEIWSERTDDEIRELLRCQDGFVRRPLPRIFVEGPIGTVATT